ncbi:hypothetical protein MTO96_006083 [Rhipicephalus appendiculatus]
MASSSLDQITFLLAPLTTAATRGGHERTQPVSLSKVTLDVRIFTGLDARKSLFDFLDQLSTYRTVSGVSELDVLERVLPVALPGTAAQ